MVPYCSKTRGTQWLPNIKTCTSFHGLHAVSLYRRLPFSHWRSFEPKMAKVGRIRTRPFENNACMGAHIKKTQHYGSRMHQHSHVELALAKATKTTFKIASRTSWWETTFRKNCALTCCKLHCEISQHHAHGWQMHMKVSANHSCMFLLLCRCGVYVGSNQSLGFVVC